MWGFWLSTRVAGVVLLVGALGLTRNSWVHGSRCQSSMLWPCIWEIWGVGRCGRPPDT